MTFISNIILFFFNVKNYKKIWINKYKMAIDFLIYN